MRKKENLRKFGHDTKSKAAKRGYTVSIYGQGGSTTKDEAGAEIDETVTPPLTAGEGEPLPKRQIPFESWGTRLREHWPLIAVTTLITALLAFFSWVGLTLIDQVSKSERREESFSNLKEDVIDLKEKYDSLNETTIRSSTLIEEIQRDLDRLYNGI